MMFEKRDPFFVQATPRGLWHVETEDHPEVMLCGETIPVESSQVRVQHRWGTKPCPWCKNILDRHTSGRFSPS